jgi:hypothetical protein
MSHSSSAKYRKIEIDNPICNRRFHIAWEEGTAKVVPETRVNCPHCGVTLFEAKNHAPVILLREENLVNAPDGTRRMCYECKLQPHKS